MLLMDVSAYDISRNESVADYATPAQRRTL